MSDVPGLSIVVPAHNSGPRLRETLQQLTRELGRDDVEVIIVENGSSDNTWEIAEELAQGSWSFPVRAVRSEVGLGAAYLTGASGARGDVVLLTADDLPFGVTDIRSWESIGSPTALVIGSKAHPASVVPRSIPRTVMSWGYRFLRRVILGMSVADCQGTLFVDREWLQRRIPSLREHGYLTSTEIVYLAQLDRTRVIEVPVVLHSGHASGRTRIRTSDVWDMAFGLLRLRRRRREFRATAGES
ncbi:glycosyltransferase family 2 protein [Arachnia propionica]|uniref:glycosyltransferase family 2 protein n=1 Tax=Arachnia propionica TaxID=1750 RepID=UPI0030CA5DB2